MAHSSTRLTFKPHVALLSSLLLLALSACGGGETPTTTPSSAAPAPTSPASPQIAIVTQPGAQSVTAGQAATFTVGATGDGLTYQWQRNGVDIAGATGASYTLSNPQPADTGAGFGVVVRSAGASVTSATATLRVAPRQGTNLVAGALGGRGDLDGKDSRLMAPSAMAMDPAGRLVFADQDWSRPFRMLASDGTVTTLGPRPATIDTYLTFAIAFDAAGNRFDASPMTIYKVTPAGVRSVFAGSRYETGSVDGTGEAARFAFVTDMAIDAAGMLYVADSVNKNIRRITPAGVVTTLAGTPNTSDAVDGNGRQAHFDMPTALAMGPNGMLYIQDSIYLRTMNTAGDVKTLSLHEEGSSSTATLGATDGMAVDAAGNLYVSEIWSRCKIVRITPDGVVSTFAGDDAAFGTADGQGKAARFCRGNQARMGKPVFDAAGNLFVADSDNGTIRRITPSGLVSTVAGRAAVTGNADAAAGAGEGMARFARAAVDFPYNNMLKATYALALDGQGNTYVGEIDRVRKVASNGAVTTLALPFISGNNGSPARYYPSGPVSDGSVLVVANGVISRIDATGAVRAIAGVAGTSGTLDGDAARATFNQPSNLIIDGLGNIYLQDLTVAANRADVRPLMRKITTDGKVTTISNTDGAVVYVWTVDRSNNLVVGNVDGSLVQIAPNGNRSVLRQPTYGNSRTTALAADRDGNLYIADVALSGYGSEDVAVYNAVVRRRTPAGAESIVAGNVASLGVRLGVSGSLGIVDAMAVGDDGTLVVMSENAVLRVVP